LQVFIGTWNMYEMKVIISQPFTYSSLSSTVGITSVFKRFPSPYLTEESG
jgi:hypothetical protein